MCFFPVLEQFKLFKKITWITISLFFMCFIKNAFSSKTFKIPLKKNQYHFSEEKTRAMSNMLSEIKSDDFSNSYIDLKIHWCNRLLAKSQSQQQLRMSTFIWHRGRLESSAYLQRMFLRAFKVFKNFSKLDLLIFYVISHEIRQDRTENTNYVSTIHVHANLTEFSPRYTSNKLCLSVVHHRFDNQRLTDRCDSSFQAQRDRD